MMLSKQIRLFLTCISAACALAVFAASAATPPLPPTRSEAMSVPTVLSRADQALYRDAYALAERRRWREALSRAEQATDPLLAKALRWNYYRQRGASVDFGEIAGFLRDNPRWPGASRLQRRAEEVLDDSVSDEVLIAWFSQRRPVTGEAMIRLAETMMRSDMREGGLDWLRYAWTHNTFSRNRSRQLFRRYKSELLETDHQKRLDNLLWKGHRGSARGMLTLVTSDQRRLAEARMALMARARGVDHKVAAVPAALRNDPGLIYERARWRRRAGLNEGARELLASPIAQPGPKPEKWWLERRIAARDALSEGEPEQAYAIAAAHAQVPGSLEFAEGEWLSGWIALRFLQQGKQAREHFQRLYDNVQYPVSLARAAYWAGRASTALGETDTATRWYAIAARYPNTYYGQLGFGQVTPEHDLSLPPDPVPDAARQAIFEQDELVRIVRGLAEVGEDRLARTFVVRLSDEASEIIRHAQIARLAADAGQPGLSVRAAKGANRDGHDLYEHGYPLLAVVPRHVEPALIHAVARQESEFDPEAVSRANARGLMQLLPSTAREVARWEKMRYSKARLFEPHYNVALGSAYLSHLLDAFDGSYVQAVAAYNAGPNRVRRWVRQFGQPGTGQVDPIDWVEMIPISETRNYVQRVMENLQVYRARLAASPVKIVLLHDLHRGGRKEASAE